MQSSFSKATTLALLFGSASAQITDHPDGLGGNAPCLQSYLGVFEANGSWNDVGGDPHAVHGILANDKSIVAVGNGFENADPSAGEGKRGFIVRTNAADASGTTCDYGSSADPLDMYKDLTGAGAGCDKYKWATKLGAAGGKIAKANWVVQSSDNNYFIAVGIDQQAGAAKSQMAIWKVNAADGAVVWTMNYGTAGTVTGLESVAILSDGSFVVGGYTDSEDAFANFKSSGIVTEGKPFLAKLDKNLADGSSAPTTFAWTYSMTDALYNGSTKAIRVDSSDKIFAVVGTASAVVKLNADGSEAWKTGQLDAKA